MSPTGANNATDATPLVLRFEKVNKVQIVSEEDERYHTTLSEMIEACKRKNDYEEVKQSLEDLLVDLGKWCDQRAAIVEGCYVSWGEGVFKIFITTQGTSYRFEFDSEVADLELNFARQHPLCPIDILQMPSASPEALQSFFSPERAFQVHGKPKAASEEGRANTGVR